MFGSKTIGKIEDVNEIVQKILDDTAEKYYVIIDISNKGNVSIFIGGMKKKEGE